MRVAVEFADNTPATEVSLAAAPSSGDLINLNGTTYRVRTVTWNANPAPMRATDITIAVVDEQAQFAADLRQAMDQAEASPDPLVTTPEAEDHPS